MKSQKFGITSLLILTNCHTDSKDDNGATLAKYLNFSLRNFNKKPRKEWDLEDFERALKQIETYGDFVLNELKFHLEEKEN